MRVVDTERVTVLDTSALSVELVRFEVSRAELYIPPPPRPQVLLPLSGAYRWHVGSTTTVVDPNQVSFIRDDEATTETSAAATTVSCLVLNLAPALARQLRRDADPFASPPVVRMSPALQSRFCWFAQAVGTRGTLAPEQWEERALDLIVTATREATGRAATAPPRAARRLAERVKMMLADHGRVMSLSELAERLAVSPTYLTDAFRRAEGVPVVRYQLQLRVMRALRELPAAADLAALALDLGFSSHSHFTTAFRTAIGITPSRYRELVGSGRSKDPESGPTCGDVSLRAWPGIPSAST